MIRHTRLLLPGLILIALFAPVLISKSVPKKLRHQASAKQNEFKQVLRISVSYTDVRPRLIYAWPGPARITVENIAASDGSLVIERVNENRAREVARQLPATAKAKRAEHDVQLAEGEYVFYDSSRPTMAGRIVVKPRAQL